MRKIFSSRLQKLRYLPVLLAAYTCSLIMLVFIKRQKYVLGGHAGELFEDNGKAFYEFLCDRSDISGENIIWYTAVSISDKSINTNRIGSFKGYYDYFTAKCALYTHSSSTDIAPLAFHLKFGQPIRVFLDHGIDGLKKIGWTSKIEPADGYVVASNTGQKIKEKYWHLNPTLIINTGLARYDRLYDIAISQKSEIKRILYLPTWREWDYGMKHEEFVNTDYFKQIVAFLGDFKLQQMLKTNDALLHVELHPFCEAYLPDFQRQIDKVANIELSIGNISTEITKCDALVTDYSSVSWDFLYQNKPTIFYQFDQVRYLSDRGSYLNFERELFGPVAKDVRTVTELVSECLQGKVKVPTKLRKKYFSHIDSQNCERIFEVVTELAKEQV